jgi:Tfp pilus assembly protein PilF
MKGRVLWIGILTLAGCGTGAPTAYRAPSSAERNPVRALELSRQAADLGTHEPERAEALLREALSADLFCGPAHNNLGVLYLSQGKLYEAANELEWARKLLPGTPEPRLNLALVLDRAGQTNAAIEACEAALEVAPEHVPSLESLAQLQVRRGDHDAALQKRLEFLALRGETEAWRSWARREALKVAMSPERSQKP